MLLLSMTFRFVLEVLLTNLIYSEVFSTQQDNGVFLNSVLWPFTDCICTIPCRAKQCKSQSCCYYLALCMIAYRWLVFLVVEVNVSLGRALCTQWCECVSTMGSRNKVEVIFVATFHSRYHTFKDQADQLGETSAVSMGEAMLNNN